MAPTFLDITLAERLHASEKLTEIGLQEVRDPFAYYLKEESEE
jgi:hypothetical protein